MKKKKAIFILVIAFVGLCFWYLKSDDSSVESCETEVIKEDVATPLVIIETAKKNDKNTTKLSTVSNERKEMKNLKFHNEIYRIIGPRDGSIDKIDPGAEIGVENFFDAKERYSFFVPLYFNAKVVAVSLFRQYKQGEEKKLASVEEIKDEWYSYPPVILGDATNSLLGDYPHVSFTNISGYFYIEDGRTPYYLYEGSDDNATKYYLVSTYDKRVVVKDTRKLEAIEEPAVGKINIQGYLEMDEAFASKLTEPELIQLKKEIELTNKYIRHGVMKFDENTNIIFDKRTKQDREHEKAVLDELEASYEQRDDSRGHNPIKIKIDGNNVQKYELQ